MTDRRRRLVQARTGRDHAEQGDGRSPGASHRHDGGTGALDQATPSPGTATPAAGEPLPYSIQPADPAISYFEFDADPGAEIELPVNLNNIGDEPIEIRTYAADGYTLINGGFDARLFGEPVEETATWIEDETEQLVLEAGETIERVALVNVPDAAPPGEYFAALVVENANPVQTGNIEQVIRHAVVIMVPGPEVLAIEVGEASFRQLTDYFSVLVEIRNPGYIRVRPSGELAVYDEADNLMLTAPVALGLVLPGATTSVEIPLPQVLPIGEYIVEIILGDKERGLEPEYFDLALTVTEPPAPTPILTTEAGPVIYFGSPTPAATPAASMPTPSGETAPPPAAAIQPGADVTLNVDISLRAMPDPDSETVADLSRGATLLVIGPSQAGAGFVWWPVSDPATGTTGFVRQEFLSPVP